MTAKRHAGCRVAECIQCPPLAHKVSGSRPLYYFAWLKPRIYNGSICSFSEIVCFFLCLVYLDKGKNMGCPVHVSLVKKSHEIGYHKDYIAWPCYDEIDKTTTLTCWLQTCLPLGV